MGATHLILRAVLFVGVALFLILHTATLLVAIAALAAVGVTCWVLSNVFAE